LKNKPPPGLFSPSGFISFIVNYWLVIVIVIVIIAIMVSSCKESNRRGELETKLKRLEQIKEEFKKGEKLNNKFQETNCAICIDELSNNSDQNSTLPCGHVFHKVCINEWLKKKEECPVCRKSTKREEDTSEKSETNVQNQATNWLDFATTNLLYSYRDVSYGYTVPRTDIWTTNYYNSYYTHRQIYIEKNRSTSTSHSSGSSFGGGSSRRGGGGGASW